MLQIKWINPWLILAILVKCEGYRDVYCRTNTSNKSLIFLMVKKKTNNKVERLKVAILRLNKLPLDNQNVKILIFFIEP